MSRKRKVFTAEQADKELYRSFTKRGNQCGYKWRHEDVLSAIAHIRRLRYVDRQCGQPANHYEFYQCTHCPYLHISTSKTGSVFMYEGWNYTVGLD